MNKGRLITIRHVHPTRCQKNIEKIVLLGVKPAFSTDGLNEFYPVLFTCIKANQIFNCYLLCGLSRLEKNTERHFAANAYANIQSLVTADSPINYFCRLHGA